VVVIVLLWKNGSAGYLSLNQNQIKKSIKSKMKIELYWPKIFTPNQPHITFMETGNIGVV